MSLTTFIKRKDVREKFSQEFSLPKFNLKNKIIVPPTTDHYALVGTAFDYLLRFYAKHLNPAAIAEPWVAENAKLFLKGFVNVVDIDSGKEESFFDKRHADGLSKKVKRILENAKKCYNNYLASGNISDDLIKSALLLAQVDSIYRAGYVRHLGVIDKKDISNLRKLTSLVRPKLFRAKKLCLLNPTFGRASLLVGGADADLLVDDCLIDIKTTKILKFDKNILNQLIGYYILACIGGIGNPPKHLLINRAGIYFSRFGVLYTFPITKTINKQQFPAFVKWFERKAKEVSKEETDDIVIKG